MINIKAEKQAQYLIPDEKKGLQNISGMTDQLKMNHLPHVL